jgi:hypothetical protein
MQDSIKPMTVQDQEIVESGEPSYWSWEVQPKDVGDYELSFILSTLSEDGTSIEVPNSRVVIWLHAKETWPHWIGVMYGGILNFLNSLSGVAVGAIGALSAWFGVMSARRKYKKEGDDEKKEPEREPEPYTHPYK